MGWIDIADGEEDLRVRSHEVKIESGKYFYFFVDLC
jgi:hypothetical protein